MTRPAPTTVDAALVQLDELGYRYATSHRCMEGGPYLVAALNVVRGGARIEARGTDDTPLSAYVALVAEARRHLDTYTGVIS